MSKRRRVQMCIALAVMHANTASSTRAPIADFSTAASLRGMGMWFLPVHFPMFPYLILSQDGRRSAKSVRT
ncbi:hypothetical protein GE09DRAFT_1150934 [Coniochaeta sp. 2T2.1]|nr:hypothetical protein GE09DRAFT_1150934 [Coniochaeta sp. 2T2.1]